MSNNGTQSLLTQDELHDQILYPVVRVRCEKSGGSGVIIYSEPDPDNEGKYINIALTCEHVIADAISVKNEWDSLLKREVKKDVIKEVVVEVFEYEGSELLSANSTRADVIAYDKSHDLAAVRLHNTRQMPYVSQVIPKDDIGDLRLFDPVWTSGCSLLHDPFANPGTLTYLKEDIEEKDYMMYNAPSVFGNSGGGVFSGKTGQLLGLASRISTIQLGFGIDVMTWMGFCTQPERLYEFFEHQELQFLYDSSDSFADGLIRRESRRKESLKSLLLGQEDDDLPNKKK